MAEKKQDDLRLLNVSLILVIVLLAVIAGMAVSDLPVLPPEKIAQPSVSYSKAPAGSNFSITLEAPIDHPRGNAMDVTVVLVNGGDGDLVLLPFADGGQFEAGACPALQLASQQDKVPAVGKNQSFSSRLHLIASCGSEAQPISLHYRAQVTDSGKLKEVDGFILTTPLTPTSDSRHSWARFFTLFSSLLHLFLVPAALAGFGLWLNAAVQKRDQRLKDEQETRDRRSEVLNNQIANYRELVIGDYLPISRSMQAVEANLPEVLQSPTAEPLVPALAPDKVAKLLSAILFCRFRLRQLLRQKGGIYFRSKEAEMLFRDLVNGFFGKVGQTLGEEEYERLVDMLHADDTLAACMEKFTTGVVVPALTVKQLEQVAGILGSDQPLNASQLAAELALKNAQISQKNRDAYKLASSRFLDWVNGKPVEFRAYTRLLQIVTELLAFECDRPFYQTAPVSDAGDPRLHTSGWYFDPPTIELTASMYGIPDSLKHKVLEDPKTGKKGQKGIYPQLKSYLEAIPEKCREGVSFPPP